MKLISCAMIVGGLLMAALPPCRAWDPDGHQIVATIAYDHLNPKAKAAVDELAKEVVGPGATYDPVTIACWMDDLRDKTTNIPYHGLFFPWHYVDFGLAPTDPRPFTTPGQDNETSGNVITALKRAMVVLQGGSDPYIKTKAMAYAIVSHLVGDIHQPLHAAAYYYKQPDGRWANDAGGNKVAIVNGPAIEPKYNLHYFWDAAWRAGFDEKSGLVVVDLKYENWNHHNPQVIRPLAEELEASDKPAPTENLEPDFEGWANESNQIAREVVYPRLTFTENHRSARISAEYAALANPLARRQLVLAGYRLATLLNETLGAATPPAIPASYPAGPPSVVPDATQTAPPKK
jgi:hypothetical protein